MDRLWFKSCRFDYKTAYFPHPGDDWPIVELFENQRILFARQRDLRQLSVAHSPRYGRTTTTRKPMWS